MAGKLTYEKPVMRKEDLIEKMGLPDTFLMRAFRDPNQTFAWKINPMAKNSPIVYDTEGLEAYRQKCIANQRDINRREVGVM